MQHDTPNLKMMNTKCWRYEKSILEKLALMEHGMWSNRAITFIDALTKPLIYLEANLQLKIDNKIYDGHFELRKLEELAWNRHIVYPGIEEHLGDLRKYLLNLPYYLKFNFDNQINQSKCTYKSHRFLAMLCRRGLQNASEAD